jgi:thioredoxin reductase
MSTGDEQTYDVVVVGGGAAGLSGALTLSRARRSVLVVDAGNPRNAAADGVHNYLGREGAPPGELLRVGRGEVESYGGRVLHGAVARVEREAPSPGAIGFRVHLDGGTSVLTRRLLVATGAHDRLPDVPGLAKRWGRDVLHCPYCHGWEVRDRAIGVLSTGPLAVHQALLWSGWSADVVLFTHTGPSLTEDEREQLDARGVTVVDGVVQRVESSGDVLSGVRLDDGRLVTRQALVVSTQPTARADVPAALGLAAVPMERAGAVVAEQVVAGLAGSTEVPGVWVAGNVTDPMGQVITAAADGMRAGAAISADLIAEETAAAVDSLRAARVG